MAGSGTSRVKGMATKASNKSVALSGLKSVKTGGGMAKIGRALSKGNTVSRILKKQGINVRASTGKITKKVDAYGSGNKVMSRVLGG